MTADLFRHWRVVRSGSSSRKQQMRSLFVLTRALPEEPMPSMLRDWTLAEARRWVRLLRNGSPSLTAARRAHAFFSLAHASTDPPAFREEARRQFAQVSARDRRRMPLFWGELVLQTEPEKFEALLEEILPAARKSKRRLWMYKLPFWLWNPKIAESARARIRRFIDALPVHEVDPGVGMLVHEGEGLAALEAGDLREAAHRIAQMTVLAPYDRYPGNSLRLVEAAAGQGRLRRERRAFLDAVLQQEHRPRAREWVEALRSK